MEVCRGLLSHFLIIISQAPCLPPSLSSVSLPGPLSLPPSLLCLTPRPLSLPFLSPLSHSQAPCLSLLCLTPRPPVPLSSVSLPGPLSLSLSLLCLTPRPPVSLSPVSLPGPLSLSSVSLPGPLSLSLSLSSVSLPGPLSLSPLSHSQAPCPSLLCLTPRPPVSLSLTHYSDRNVLFSNHIVLWTLKNNKTFSMQEQWLIGICVYLNYLVISQLQVL